MVQQHAKAREYDIVYCLVVVLLTVANLVSCRQLAVVHVWLANTLPSVTELTANVSSSSSSNLSDRGRTESNVALNKTAG